MPKLAEVLTFRARRTSVASCALALMLMGFGVQGCSASKGSSSSGTTAGDGDTGDGDEGDGDDGDGDPGDGDDGDGDEGDGDGDGDAPEVPSFTYDDGEATGAFKDPDLGDDVKEHFSGDTSSSDAPELVYPLANSMHPSNLGKIEFQWKRGDSDNKEFRIEATSGKKNYRFYVPCDESECRYQMPSNEWLALGKAFAGETFKVTIAGSSGKGGKVALSDETTLHFSPQGVFGALYYWAAEAAEIKRADLGSDTATPFIQPNSPTNEYDCVGCHSVSRNGEVIAFAVAPILSSVEGSELAGIQTAPTSDPSMPYVAPKNGDSPFAGITDDDGTEMFPDGIEGPKDHLGHNVALSPTGDYAAVNGIPASTGTWPPFFEIRDTKSGNTLGKWSLADPIFGSSDDGSEKLAIFPEWAPDGKSIVVTLAEEAGENCMYTAETCKGAIAVLPVTGAGKIGSPQILVEASSDEFYFYPTWSPDGKWVAFAAGIRRMSGGKMETSQSNDNALIRMVKATGGPYKCPSKDCIELTNGRGYSFDDAEAEKGKHSTWPKFTPFAQQDGNLMFISFNSHLDYGFEDPVTGKEGERLSQIWMFAVDVSKVGSGDPSYAPIWLPQQDPGDGSLTPYWSERLPCNLDPSGGCKGCVGEEKCETQEDGQCSCVVDVL